MIQSRDLPIKVMSFNIDGGVSSRDRHFHWANRESSVMDVARKEDADVIAFQEVHTDSLMCLHETLRQHDFDRGLATVAEEPSRLATYNAIFWRRQMSERLDGGSFYLSRTPTIWSRDWEAAFVRAATWVRLRLRATGSDLLVVNTHLDHASHGARVNSCKLIAEHVEQWCRRPCSIVLMGDFNSRAWAPPNEKPADYPSPVLPSALPPAEEAHSIFMRHGFSDAYERAGFTNQLDMNTYHDYFGQRFPPVALRIDWILYRPGGCDLRVLHYRTIQTEHAGRLPSDHYPVTATFLVRV